MIMGAVLVAPAAVMAQIDEGDVVLGVTEADAIVTGAQVDGRIVYPVSVFTSELDDGFTDEPGFDSLSGTFDPGEVLGLDVLRALHVWNGEDFWTIGEPVLTISKFGNEMATPECDHRVSEGFVFGNADEDGKFHHHVTYQLAPADPGVYLLSLEVWSLDGAPTASDPVHVVFDEPGHGFDAGEAAAWVEAHLFQLACQADMSGDGVLNILDFVAMQTAFQSRSTRADVNGDCELNILDFVAFQALFLAGCE
jgi:hypothetical protein